MPHSEVKYRTHSVPNRHAVPQLMTAYLCFSLDLIKALLRWCACCFSVDLIKALLRWRGISGKQLREVIAVCQEVTETYTKPGRWYFCCL